jgi:tetratricopeptide (TPR) repeat protein
MKYRNKLWFVIGIALLILVMAGCAASRLDEAKRQFTLGTLSANVSDATPYYKAALEELDAVIARDPNEFQAYAIRGIIYRNLENFDEATANLKIAERGSYEGQLRWVPMMINLTYGDIFHGQAANAVGESDWEPAQSRQETAIQFFESVVTSAGNEIDALDQDEELGMTMRDLYLKAQARWAAAKLQMAVIAGKIETKERQNEILREGVVRLNAVIQNYPNAAPLRYYLAEGYYKQAVTIQKTDAEEGKRLKNMALAQLGVCAELGLPADLENPAIGLAQMLSPGAEAAAIEAKIMGGKSSDDN